MEDQLEGLPQPLSLKAPNEKVKSRVSHAVGAGQEDAGVAEAVVLHVSYKEPDDAEAQAKEEEAQGREQKDQVELSGPVLLGTRLDLGGNSRLDTPRMGNSRKPHTVVVVIRAGQSFVLGMNN